MLRPTTTGKLRLILLTLLFVVIGYFVVGWVIINAPVTHTVTIGSPSP